MDDLRSAVDDICRFCLYSYDDTTNDYLISPCACRGSIQYVHISCLKKWRLGTLNEEYRQICNMCRNIYTLPRKWCLEKIPLNNGFLHILENGIIVNLFSFYIYFILITRIIPFLKRKYITYETIKYNTYYLYTLGVITSIYLFSCIYLFLNVKNKILYLKYIFNYQIQYISLLILNMMLTFVIPFPFGQIYVLLWSKYVDHHRKLLMKINMDGEL